MAGMDINYASSSICRKCGVAYGRLKGYFPVSYAQLYKGVGHLPYCKDCVDTMYANYLKECNGDQMAAVRQMCRKLDLFWNEKVYSDAEKVTTARSVMTKYLAKLNSTRWAGLSYDDTLRAENTMWSFGVSDKSLSDGKDIEVESEEKDASSDIEYDISDAVKEFWGPGYTDKMYFDLEQRKRYLISRLPDEKKEDMDFGTEILIRQACNLELDINRERAAGRPIEKQINALNTVLGGLKLRPAQKDGDADASLESTPFGVWIRRWENERPVPEVDPELRDVDGIIRYIEVWFKGHLSKMLNLKNSYSKMYEEEIAKRRVERPEYDDDDDEQFFNDIFANDGDEP